MSRLTFNYKFNYRPYFRYHTEVLFAEYPIPRNLFGHIGFFNHLSVALRSRFGLIYLNPDT